MSRQEMQDIQGIHLFFSRLEAATNPIFAGFLIHEYRASILDEMRVFRRFSSGSDYPRAHRGTKESERVQGCSYQRTPRKSEKGERMADSVNSAIEGVSCEFIQRWTQRCADSLCALGVHSNPDSSADAVYSEANR